MNGVVGWRRVQLGDVANFINGYAFGPAEWGTKGRPIVRIQNLTGTSNRWNFYAGSLPDKYLVRAGDILVSWSASLGAFRWDRDEAWVNQHIFKVDEISNDVDRGFLYFGLLNLIGSLKTKTHGSTMKHVTRKSFLSTELSIPELEEQRSIAYALDSALSARKHSETVEDALRALFTALRSHYLDYGPVPLSQRNLIERQATNAGESPKTWKVVRLEDFAQLQRGFDITKKQQRPGPYPVISSSGPTSTHAEFKQRAPGVLVGRKGSVGRVHFVQDDYWPHDTTLWVRDFRGNDPEYVFRFLEAFDFTPYVTGVANPSLNRNHIHDLPVAVPPRATQEKIAQGLRIVEKRIAAEQLRKSALDQLFRSLLSELMTAKRRVNGLLEKVP